MPNQAFAVRGQGSETLELDIYDDIGEDWWGEGVTAKQVRRTLKAEKPGTIRVRIKSAGGDVFDGFAIYELLNEHSARVLVQVDSLAASMASVIAMAGDEVEMASGAMMMIHNPWALTMGEADDLRKQADVLDKMRDQIAAVYAAKTGRKREDLLAMMDAETWMTAQEAVDAGFADRVKPNKTKKATKAQARAFACLNLTDRNVPDALRKHIEEAQALLKQPPQVDDQQILPGIEARENQEDKSMQSVIKELGLPENADEATVLAAVKAIKTSARVGSEIEKTVGSLGDHAIGAVRALKSSQETNASLAQELGKVKVAMARGSFDTARDKGLADKKLTPATAKFYTDQFEASVAAGDDGSSVVAQLTGFLAHAPRIAALTRVPNPGDQELTNGALTHGGKSFAQMKHIERARLKQSDPELYSAMREEWEESGRPAA
jgi:ATP-dependent protease ClpP protease subunit